MGKGSFNFAPAFGKKSGSDGSLFNKICWSLEHPDPSAEALHAEQLLRQGMWNTLLGDLDDPIGAFMNGGRSTVLHTLAAAFCFFWHLSVGRAEQTCIGRISGGLSALMSFDSKYWICRRV